jgi:hypothetical protein
MGVGHVGLRLTKTVWDVDVDQPEQEDPSVEEAVSSLQLSRDTLRVDR